MTKKNIKPNKAFISSIIIGFLLYFLMLNIQPCLPQILFDYNTWFNYMENSALWRSLWVIGDPTEPFFHKTIFGGLFVTIGSFIAYVLDKRHSKFRGIPISYGMGKIWPWIFCAALLSTGIAALLFGGLRFQEDAWSATFVPYVSVASAVILVYGPRLATLLTGAILGAIFTTTIAIFIRLTIAIPTGLPGIIGNVSGMWIGGIITFEICRFMPWMVINPLQEKDISPSCVDGEISIAEYKIQKPNSFFVRRMIADYSEPMFVGNEIAGLCLVIGSCLSWVLNPFHPVYGTGLFPAILLSQILTGAIAIYVYWDNWIENDFFPTFVPIVSVAPAMVLMFGDSMWIIIISSILGAIACPAIAVMINEHIPKYWHGMVGFTASMAICSCLVAIFLRYLVMAFPFLVA